MYLHVFITYINIECQLGAWNIYNLYIKCDFPLDFMEILLSISFSNLLCTFRDNDSLLLPRQILKVRIISLCKGVVLSPLLHLETP